VLKSSKIWPEESEKILYNNVRACVMEEFYRPTAVFVSLIAPNISNYSWGLRNVIVCVSGVSEGLCEVCVCFIFDSFHLLISHSFTRRCSYFSLI